MRIYDTPVGIVALSHNCFEISDPEYGKITVSIPEKTAPMWYGDYQVGKLAIYLADVSTPELVVVIYVLAEQKDPLHNGVGFAVFDGDFEINLAIDGILKQINASHLALAEIQKNGNTVH